MKNKYKIIGDYTEIYILRRNGKRFTCIIDTEDLDRVLKFGKNICIDETSYGLWVKFNRPCIMLHKFLLNSDSRQIVKFLDGNRLNLRKSNFCLLNDPTLPENNLIGKRIGMLTVVNYTENFSRAGNRLWECKCDCGNTRLAVDRSIMTGNVTSCGCKRQNKNNPRFSGYQELHGRYMSNLRQGARNRGLSWEINAKIAYNLLVAQQFICALSGRALVLGAYGVIQTASLDRIDSKKGYTLENIQWVHKDINRMKMAFDETYFIKTCEEITKYRGCLND